MKMVVVGGNSRDIGKTSVVVELIRALPHYHWTAIKLTQYGEQTGKEQNDTPPELPFVIQEETNRGGQTDTSRFLAAGARRALWVRVRPGALATAIPALRQAIVHDEYVIVESNSILRFYKPNVYITLLDPAQKDFKPSAQEFLHRADAYLVLEPGLENPRWEGISLDRLRHKPVFRIRGDGRVAPEIAAFVESRLRATEDAFPLFA